MSSVGTVQFIVCVRLEIDSFHLFFSLQTDVMMMMMVKLPFPEMELVDYRVVDTKGIVR